jgi:hypothetical protein
MPESWRPHCNGDKIAIGHADRHSAPTPSVPMAVNPDFGAEPAVAAAALLDEVCAIAQRRATRPVRIPNPSRGVPRGLAAIFASAQASRPSGKLLRREDQEDEPQIRRRWLIDSCVVVDSHLYSPTLMVKRGGRKLTDLTARQVRALPPDELSALAAELGTTVDEMVSRWKKGKGMQ